MVIAPATTGKEVTNKNAVTSTDHTYRGTLCMNIPGALILNIVAIKLIDPKTEEAPEI